MKLTKIKSLINEEIEHVNKDVIDKAKIDDTIVTAEPVSFTSAVKEAQETRKRAKEVYAKLQSKADFFAKHQTGVAESVKKATKIYLVENFEDAYSPTKNGYVVQVKNRKELGNLITESKNNGLNLKVCKSLQEGYRYKANINFEHPITESINGLTILFKDGSVKYCELTDSETEELAVKDIVDNLGNMIQAIYSGVEDTDDSDKIWDNDSLKESYENYPDSLYVAIPFSDFRPWGQAQETLQTIIDNDKFDEFERYLLSTEYNNVIDETYLNDLLAYDWESLFAELGINEEEEDDLEEDEEEEDDE